MRNVTIVVAVLMTSCQVSTLRMNAIDGTQITISSTQRLKNHARDTKVLVFSAKRSKNETCGVTEDGMSLGSPVITTSATHVIGAVATSPTATAPNLPGPPL